MKAQPSSPRRQGITRRIALLSWLVTIVTLVIFIFVIIPEQKRTYLENLESKARGISASLQDVTAGGVVTEDYSSVVDHCKQVLYGDRSIHFLVITKNDGFSLMHETGGTAPQEARWRTETLDAYWHPAVRKPQSRLGIIPIFERRIFHYAKPFDYSGIEWGWIHVGLSLEAYDESVKAVYWRTGLLAVICLLLSLGASHIHARRLVRPLLDLNAVVSQVTAGELAARADIRSGDEIQDLAESFNTMTDTLLQRDRILESVRVAAQQFLSTSDWRQVVHGILAQIGRVVGASRAYVFENQRADAGPLLAYQRYEWSAEGIPSQLGNLALQGCDYRAQGFDRWTKLLERGEVVAGNMAELPASERPLLESQGIRSVLAIPIRVEGVWWGFLGLDECRRDREWTMAERDSMRAAAEILGSAITRYRTQQALLEAKDTLEQRVLQRTHELQEQMAAKERAHAELAEVQNRLIESSRMAGMAEVATGVLHNVGNVLNSVSVSATLVSDRLRDSRLAQLRRATAMLRERNDHLVEFLTTDPKGRLLPEYLGAATEQLAAEQAELIAEMHSVGLNIEHIKEIVAMQQSYARVSGAQEYLPASELVEDALRMNTAAFARHRIRVVRDYDENTPDVCVDRHKVLQILVNLLRNAKYAMDQQLTAQKLLTIRIDRAASGRVRVAIRDNGIGIPPENLLKIFGHGFTTKKDGHGFGLHSGANAAKEMGGSLSVQSGGVGHGAEFTLELPIGSDDRTEEKPMREEIQWII